MDVSGSLKFDTSFANITLPRKISNIYVSNSTLREMNDPNSNQNDITHEISSNDIRNSQIDASTKLEKIKKITGKIKTRNIHKNKTEMKFENGNSSDRYYQFIERLLILLGFGSPTVYFLNYDWLKTYVFCT